MKFKNCPVNVPFTLPQNPMADGRTFVLSERDPQREIQQVTDDKGERWLIGPDETIAIVRDEDDIIP